MNYFHLKNYYHLLSLLPWYHNSNGYQRELSVDKATNMSMYGWPVTIFSIKKYGLKCDEISSSILKYTQKIPHEKQQVQANIEGYGIVVSIINLDFYMTTEKTQLYTWLDIKEYINWLNKGKEN